MIDLPTRRRFLSIAAASGAVFAQGLARATSAVAARTAVWKGTAMGALACITLVHEDSAFARATIARCVDEIERLEAIFSLYRSDSALSRLNAAGELRDPPTELLELLSVALAIARASGGAFDPSIQPLYRLYAEHFAAVGAPAGGPSPQQIARVLKSVDHASIALDARWIRLHRPGAAITLNGIAQGFATDRVADLLRDSGLRNVLVDLGEMRAAGRSPDGRPWTAAVIDPGAPQRTLLALAMGGGEGQAGALATSAGYGTRFGADPHLHHLLDPRSGRSASHYSSVSVTAERATLADGLSTALSILAPAPAAALLSAYPSARAYFADAAGRITLRQAG